MKTKMKIVKKTTTTKPVASGVAKIKAKISKWEARVAKIEMRMKKSSERAEAILEKNKLRAARIVEFRKRIGDVKKQLATIS